jgi:hypothetical protein
MCQLMCVFHSHLTIPPQPSAARGSWAWSTRRRRAATRRRRCARGERRSLPSSSGACGTRALSARHACSQGAPPGCHPTNTDPTQRTPTPPSSPPQAARHRQLRAPRQRHDPGHPALPRQQGPRHGGPAVCQALCGCCGGCCGGCCSGRAKGQAGPRERLATQLHACLPPPLPQVGVFAQLATVEDRRLAEVLSAAYLAAMQVRSVRPAFDRRLTGLCNLMSHSALPRHHKPPLPSTPPPTVVVVKTYECISRLRTMLGAASGAPTPSMLSLTLIQPFRWACKLWGGGQGRATPRRPFWRSPSHRRPRPSVLRPAANHPPSPESEGRAALRIMAGMKGIGPLARRLTAEATEGADDALPLVLPHTRMLAALQERGESLQEGRGFRPGAAAPVAAPVVRDASRQSRRDWLGPASPPRQRAAARRQPRRRRVAARLPRLRGQPSAPRGARPPRDGHVRAAGPVAGV